MVNQSINRILKSRPIDPLSAIASQLISEAKSSQPVFDRIVAKKVCLQETLNVHSLKLQVFLNYQGRTEMRYEHILTYDQDEHEKSFIYDNKADRTGLEQACNLINNEVNRVLHGIVLDDISKIDSALLGYFDNKAEKQEEIGTNVIKAVSEAILLGTTACYQKLDLYKGLNETVLR